jgi:hypothetical protein
MIETGKVYLPFPDQEYRPAPCHSLVPSLNLINPHLGPLQSEDSEDRDHESTSKCPTGVRPRQTVVRDIFVVSVSPSEI